MMPNTEFEQLVQRYVDGKATPAELERLNEQLRDSPEARESFIQWMNLDTALEANFADWDSQDATIELKLQLPPGTESRVGEIQPVRSTRSTKSGNPLARAIFAVAASVTFITGAWWWYSASQQPAVQVAASLVVLEDATWTSAGKHPVAGDTLEVGQRLDLAAGQVAIEFVSGAKTRLYGPAVFEVESSNSGFLLSGHAWSQADTPQSQGFVIRTRNAKFVDRGTEFWTRVQADGHSQVEVASGKVDVQIPGQMLQRRLVSGSSMGIEPGEIPVLVRIEPGDETPAFRFASIEPPSNQDFADASRGNAKASAKGTLGVSKEGPGDKSGLPAILLNGSGQSARDVPHESFYFQDDTVGAILLDLGESVAISKINTYTWHQHPSRAKHRERAVQRFVLWGFEDNELPSDAEFDSTADRWVKIARVNSDAFFGVTDRLDRPAQQACSIEAAQGSLGRFRYLLFKVQPTQNLTINPQTNRPFLNPKTGRPYLNHTFYGEIDVYAE